MRVKRERPPSSTAAQPDAQAPMQAGSPTSGSPGGQRQGAPSQADRVAGRLPTGSGSPSFRSVVEMWRHRIDSTPRSVAMWARGKAGWEDLSWQQADVRVRHIAAGLLARGVERADRVALLSATRVEWALVNFGILMAGGAVTTIYPSHTADEAAFILTDSGAAVVFCEDPHQVAKVLAGARDEATPRLIVQIAGTPSTDPRVLGLAALEAEGAAWLADHPDALTAVADALTPDDLATLIYTSGTSGRPKGVRLSHDAWVYEAEAIDRLGLITPADRQLLFLPLAHVFAQVMLVIMVRLGVSTAFDGNRHRLLDNLSEIEPTFFAVVPRVLEKAAGRIRAEVRDRGLLADTVFSLALAAGKEAAEARETGRPLGRRARLRHRLADRAVLGPLRARFGARLRFIISGGAPLPVEVGRFLAALGLTVCEGYGLTESAAASTVNTPDDAILGTVGRPLPGCEVRIADDGEILLRSRGVMQGYHGLPADTAEALTSDGWLRTGDVGQLLPSGHLRITDRKKDLIITGNGKNVAPARVEGLLTARFPVVEHVLIHGDRRPFCSALVTLDTEAVAAWARREGVSVPAEPAALARHPGVRALVAAAFEELNRELPSYEKIRAFEVLPEGFTQDNGLLTPSLKVRRKAVEARYRALLDGFYASSAVDLR